MENKQCFKKVSVLKIEREKKIVEMSNSRSNFQFLNNPLAIRQEIQRFESVHPSIYAIYDLIELVPDQQIAQQIRDHVVCIEGLLNNSEIYIMCIF